jgi:hypothetical protein
MNSYVDLQDKKEVYESLEKFKAPIDMICNSSATYCQNRHSKSNEISELDKLILMICAIKAPLDKEYKNNEPL